MEEIWKDIEGFEGYYQVSNFGNVRSLDRYVKNPYGTLSLRKRKINKQRYDKDGYKQVNLSKDGKNKYYFVHRLVAQAFLPNPNNYPIINHIDEVKDNNCVDNLEWCTVKYNTNYGNCPQNISNGLKGKHINRPDHSKPVLQYTKSGEFVSEYPSLSEAHRKIGIPYQNISSCCNGKSKTAKGYKWKFKN